MPRMRDILESTKTDEEWQRIHDLELEYRHTEFKNGNGQALLSAIRYCGNEQIIMPEWVVQAFFEATHKFNFLHVKTLDEAFGIKWPKGKKLPAARKRMELSYPVYLACKKEIENGASIGKELFISVGKPFGISGGLAEKYYYSGKKEFEDQF